MLKVRNEFGKVLKLGMKSKKELGRVSNFESKLGMKRGENFEVKVLTQS